MRAVALVLLMLASTQLVLLTGRDYSPGELEPVPQRFEVDNSQVAMIDIGLDHSCAIGTSNQMKCWGSGVNGKTGHENTEDYGDDEEEMGQYLMFTDVGSGLTFTEVAAGEDFTCALLSDASVKCWGVNEYLGSQEGLADSGAKGDGYLEMGSGVSAADLGSWNATSISAGDTHACSIVNNGSSDSLVCWGGNLQGQLGLGNTDTIGDDDDLVGEPGHLPHVDLPNRGVGLSQVSAGSEHTCVLWDDGEMG